MRRALLAESPSPSPEGKVRSSQRKSSSALRAGAPTPSRRPGLPGAVIRDVDRTVTVADTVQGHSIELVRTADIPAGRVQPGHEYETFRKFVQEADALLDREVYLGK